MTLDEDNNTIYQPQRSDYHQAASPDQCHLVSTNSEIEWLVYQCHLVSPNSEIEWLGINVI